MKNTELETKKSSEQSIAEKDYKEYLPYLHLMGVLNFLIPVFNLIMATICYVVMANKWKDLKEELIKIVNFCFVEILTFTVITFLIPVFYSKLYSSIFSYQDFDVTTIALSPTLILIVMVFVRILFVLVYFKNYQRASVERTTKYPLRQLPLGKIYFSLISKVLEDKEDAIETKLEDKSPTQS